MKAQQGRTFTLREGLKVDRIFGGQSIGNRGIIFEQHSRRSGAARSGGNSALGWSWCLVWIAMFLDGCHMLYIIVVSNGLSTY